MTKRLIIDSQIRHASEMNDLDDACRFIQNLLGVTEGDAASQVFSGFDWANATVNHRISLMRAYVKIECDHAQDHAQ